MSVEAPSVVFYRRGRRGEPEPVGVAIYWRGRVELVGDVGPAGRLHERYRVDTTRVYAPDGRRLTPADGLAYLEALPRTFHGSHFWAAAIEATRLDSPPP